MKRLYAVHFEKDGRECAFGWAENRKDEEMLAQRIATIDGVSNVRVEERVANLLIWKSEISAWCIHRAKDWEYLGQVFACKNGYRLAYRNDAGTFNAQTFDNLTDARYYAERFKLV
jgi:hypothetical protein